MTLPISKLIIGPGKHWVSASTPWKGATNVGWAQASGRTVRGLPDHCPIRWRLYHLLATAAIGRDFEYCRAGTDRIQSFAHSLTSSSDLSPHWSFSFITIFSMGRGGQRGSLCCTASVRGGILRSYELSWPSGWLVPEMIPVVEVMES